MLHIYIYDISRLRVKGLKKGKEGRCSTVTISLPKGHTMEKFIRCKSRQYFISLWYYKFAILNYTDIPIKTMYAAVSAIIFAAHGELLQILHSTCIGSRTHTHL